jgi:tripeptide aminopeptidase
MHTLLEQSLVRYCAIDTPSDTNSPTTPSTLCQFDLLRLLQRELLEMGAEKVELLDAGFVIASIPGNRPGPVMALLAHVDTTAQFCATGVKPIVHRNWDGRPIALPDDPSRVLSAEEFPYLATKIGHDIVTASGLSLLGADDKAGVAIAMATGRHLLAHPEIPHPEVRLCFTCDEEIGRGCHHLPLDKLGAVAAYTLDGGPVGELCSETFSANKAVVEITGVSIHPGTAKGKLVNALHLAAKLITALESQPRPETTDGREGFIYCATIEGTAAHAKIQFPLRDFDLEKLAAHGEAVRKVCLELAAAEPRAQIEYRLIEQYRNMRAGLELDHQAIAKAEQAYRNCGLEPASAPIRGGTDGSVLTARGLPTPNLFTGMQNYHSPLEWVSVQDMARAVDMCVELVQQW